MWKEVRQIRRHKSEHLDSSRPQRQGRSSDSHRRWPRHETIAGGRRACDDGDGAIDGSLGLRGAGRSGLRALARGREPPTWVGRRPGSRSRSRSRPGPFPAPRRPHRNRSRRRRAGSSRSTVAARRPIRSRRSSRAGSSTCRAARSTTHEGRPLLPRPGGGRVRRPAGRETLKHRKPGPGRPERSRPELTGAPRPGGCPGPARPIGQMSTAASVWRRAARPRRDGGSGDGHRGSAGPGAFPPGTSGRPSSGSRGRWQRPPRGVSRSSTSISGAGIRRGIQVRRAGTSQPGQVRIRPNAGRSPRRHARSVELDRLRVEDARHRRAALRRPRAAPGRTSRAP